MAALSLTRHATPRPGGVVFAARGVPPAPRAAGAPARRFPSDRRRRLARPLVANPLSALAVPPPAFRAPPRASRAPALVVRASDGRNLAQYPVADRRAELSKMTMAQLKPLCKGSGLKLGGKKSELVDRLLEHEFGTTDDEADIDPREDIVGLAKEWRDGRGVGGGVSFGEVDSVEAALRSAGFVDERAADAAYSALGFDDGGYSRSSEARGDQGPAAESSYAARLMGRDGGGFDDGGGSGWGDDDWDDRDAAAESERRPEPTAEEIKAAAKARARAERLSLEKRSAMVAALRQLAFEREGFESDPRVHLEAVSRAIDRAYRDMRWSKFAKMDPRSREACVDINVAAGTLTVLAQRVGRGGTVEWEVDDTEAFLEAHGKRHQLRKLARMFSEELAEAVSVSASESYRRRLGEMVEATVVAQGRGGEWLLKLDDGAFACLPEEESIPGKRYSQGDRVCALVVEVEEKTWAADKRAPVVVSTAIAGLLAEVFKAEIPEVANGDVVIKSVARVSGKLSKVAVARREGSEDGEDPVSICVGEQNVRLRNIRERLGGEICQVLAWSDDREALVAQALFPAQVERVEQRFDEDEFDERGEKRRLDKFVAYVNRFDEAKAIGVGGMNVKLAAALCGCFILVERVEETRGFDDGFGSGWGDEGYDDGFRRRSDERREGIDISGAGDLDEFGWPDLDAAETPVEPTARSRFDDLIGGGVGAANGVDGEEDDDAYVDPRDDDANWEEVGPGKVGVVTFGGNLGAGIAGGCSFMGDPEFAEAEALGDAAERRMGLLAEAEDDGFEDEDFYDDAADDDVVDHLFAEDDLMGEDWNR